MSLIPVITDELIRKAQSHDAEHFELTIKASSVILPGSSLDLPLARIRNGDFVQLLGRNAIIHTLTPQEDGGFLAKGEFLAALDAKE